MNYNRIITETKLESWVNGHPTEAQSLLPELVDRLVSASVPIILQKDISKDIREIGPDGFIEVEAENNDYKQYIPDGISFWEFGTNNNAFEKIKEDYKKYEEDRENLRIRGYERKSVSLVFVSPRPAFGNFNHNKQGKWLQDILDKNEWKDVRIIDAGMLCDWVLETPIVTMWLAEKMEIPVHDMESLEKILPRIYNNAKPVLLTPDVFLTSRDEAKKKVDDFLDKKLSHLSIKTNNKNQIPPFVASCIEKRNDKEKLYAKTLVVTSEDAFNTLRLEYKNQIFILICNNISAPHLDISASSEKGHQIIFWTTESGYLQESENFTELPDCVDQQLRISLIKAKNSESDSFKYSCLCYGNPQNIPNIVNDTIAVKPSWRRQKISTKTLTEACLIGQWSEYTEKDKEWISKYTNTTYDDWILNIKDTRQEIPEIPIYYFGGTWSVTRRMEIWTVICDSVSIDVVKKFCEESTSVLKEKNKKYDEEDIGGFYLIDDITHSKSLRSGVAEGLAFLSCTLLQKSDELSVHIQSILDKTVSDILLDGDWKLYASLGTLLCYLAEASPTSYMNATEKLNQETIKSLVSKSPNYLSSLPHIWWVVKGLEILAISNDYFTRAVQILVQLIEKSDIDITGKTTGLYSENQPYQALRSILSPFPLGTYATPEKCSAILKKLSECNPDIYCRLLLDVLRQPSVFKPIGEYPVWRDELLEPSEKRTSSLYCEYLKSLEENLQTNHRLALILLTDYVYLPDNARYLLTKCLEECSTDEYSNDEQQQIWLALSDAFSDIKKINDEKRYPKMEQTRIRSLSKKFESDIPIYKYQHYFIQDNFMIYHSDSEKATSLKKDMQKSLQIIYNEGGVNEIVKFAHLVQNPAIVGCEFANVVKESADRELIPKYLGTDDAINDKLMSGFIHARFKASPSEWMNKLDINSWSTKQKLMFLLSSPCNRQTWELAIEFLGEDENEYWKDVYVFSISETKDESYAVNRLIKYHFPAKAVTLLSTMLYKRRDISTEWVISVLFDLAQNPKECQNVDHHDIEHLIHYIEKNYEGYENHIIPLEIGYYTCLNHINSNQPTVFEREIAKSPDFFLMILKIIFKPELLPGFSSVPKHNIGNMFLLLQNTRIVPGMDENGFFDAEIFKSWYHRTLELCPSDLLKLAKENIGNILTSSPQDSDLWISKEIAKILDEVGNEDIRRGFVVGLINHDGVHFDDGEWEDDKIEEFKTKADSLDVAGFFRFAEYLRSDVLNHYKTTKIWAKTLFTN